LDEGLLTRTFSAGTEIFRYGDMGDCAYIIDQGEVEIIIPLSSERSATSKLGPGQLFGEMALIDGSRRLGTARASSDTVVRIITSSQILNRLRQSDEIVAFILKITLARYRNLLNQVRGGEAGASKASDESVSGAELSNPDALRAVAKLEREDQLREALGRGEFLLLYQPLVSFAAGERIRGFEALMRWRSPRHGLVPPKDFIPLAEETGLIVPMCRWAISSAAGSLAKFQRQVGERATLMVSVNITKHQIDDEETFTVIDRALGAGGFAPEQLKLELTESVLMDDYARTLAWISSLKDRGLRISIDDFGTGYSSLGYLHRFRVDELKIDQSFVASMLEQPRSMEIVRAIVGLARGLGLQTVAEGVETPEQAARLKEIGCDYGQGYLYSRPVEEAVALSLLAERS
jgi:EAL domain-containing protein (putative c-di-GMP-specific phosphodiesterase class I)